MALQCIRRQWVTTIVLLGVSSQGLASPLLNRRSNGTITTENDGSQVWCEPSQWHDVLWFWFANFLLHALSVRSLPGESWLSSIVFKFCCLLVPYTGVRRGLCLILRASNLAGNDLQAAARANALCMVIRGPEWRPRDGQIVDGCSIGTSKAQEIRKRKKPSKSPVVRERQCEKGDAPRIAIVDTSISDDTTAWSPVRTNEVTLKTKDPYAPPPDRSLLDRCTRWFIETHRFHSQPPTANLVDHVNVKIHGVCQLAPGYRLSYIPEDMKVYSYIKHQRSLSISRLLGVNHTPDIKLASTHDVPRILFSIIQTAMGGYSLYRAGGTQIERYGYAAYGLTVLPYMMVSVINLIGSLLSSEYETVYLVHSAIMDEMKLRGGLCDGVVGTLERPPHQTYADNDGETETRIQGQTNEFAYSSGELHCHDTANGSPSVELQVATANHKDPERYLWLAQKWSRSCEAARKNREGRKDESPSAAPLLCVPSHSGFTRLSPLWYQSWMKGFTIVLLMLALGLPYVIIAVLTGWKPGNSTSTQRSFVTNWYICGQIQGYAVSMVEGVDGKKNVMKSFAIIFLTYGSYSIMGFYVVVQEMLETGTCKAL
ncbi:MAG: hypothetical protein Q9168_006511 [Polycauliona sp. 1 TL-2023]